MLYEIMKMYLVLNNKRIEIKDNILLREGEKIWLLDNGEQKTYTIANIIKSFQIRGGEAECDLLVNLN